VTNAKTRNAMAVLCLALPWMAVCCQFAYAEEFPTWGTCSDCGVGGAMRCDDITAISNCWHDHGRPPCGLDPTCGVCKPPKCIYITTVSLSGVCTYGAAGEGNLYTIRFRQWDCSAKGGSAPNPCFTLHDSKVSASSSSCTGLEGGAMGDQLMPPDLDPCTRP
jgi:hypothetical protein